MRVVVKLGSSVVAEDDGTLRSAAVAAVCDELAARHRAGDEIIVVSSGAIALGIRVMGLPGRPSAIADLQAASAVGQGGLQQGWATLLADRDVKAAQVLLTFFDLRSRAHYLNARQTLRRLLDWRVVPVVNENDTTTTDEISFGDNDFLAAQIAILMGAQRLVLLTVTDGIHTADPRIDPAARRVPEIGDAEALAALEIGDETSALGSGGMRSKVVAAEMATAAGIPAVIGSGLQPGHLGRLLDGDPGVGTRFPAGAARVSSFKLWLKYAKPVHGTLEVDAGAARALRTGGTSLLPVGIVAVRGVFEAGDAVEVTHAGEPVGKGIVSGSATDLRRMAGLKSGAVRDLLADAPDEAIHRDSFVLA